MQLSRQTVPRVGFAEKGGRTEVAANYSGAPLLGKLNKGGVCRNGREDGGGDKLQAPTRQTVPRVGFAEMGGRTVEATNDKHLMARVCRNWSGEVEAIHKPTTCAGVHENYMRFFSIALAAAPARMCGNEKIHLR